MASWDDVERIATGLPQVTERPAEENLSCGLTLEDQRRRERKERPL